MAELAIKPLLAHEPEATPPGRWRILLLPVAMAVLGILLATAAASSGQQTLRERETLQKEKSWFYWENEAAQAKLRNGDPAKIAEYEAYAKKYRDTPLPPSAQPGRYFTGWDANRYEGIVTDGYVYHLPTDSEEDKDAWALMRPGWDEKRVKNVAWYPLYPMLAWAVMTVTGMSATAALTVVSEVCIVLAAAVMFLYARRHYYNRMPKLELAGEAGREAHPARRWDLMPEDSAAMWAVAALIFGPCALFLYANYTESLFVLLLVTFLYCLQGRLWWQAAVVAALASACRSQGVLLGPVLALTFLMRSDVRHWSARTGLAACLGAVSVIGVGCYMLYLQKTFGDPLAFMHVQKHWNVGINMATIYHAINPVHAMTRILDFGFYIRPMDWPRFWEALCIIWPPVMLLILGGRFLSFELELIGWMMWGLPYVSNSLAGNPIESTAWMSMGRFMAVMIPAQIIVGAVLVRFRWLGVPFLAAWASAFGLFAYKFGAGEWVG